MLYLLDVLDTQLFNGSTNCAKEYLAASKIW